MLTPEQRRLRASIAAHVQWAGESDPTARTQAGRDGMLAKFAREVDPAGRLPEQERLRRAEHLRKAHMKRLALASSKARSARKAARREGGRNGP